jgi:hypothetical protein
MDFSVIIKGIVTFLQNNPLITLAMTIVLIILLYRKPKIFFTIFLITLL